MTYKASQTPESRFLCGQEKTIRAIVMGKDCIVTSSQWLEVVNRSAGDSMPNPSSRVAMIGEQTGFRMPLLQSRAFSTDLTDFKIPEP